MKKFERVNQRGGHRRNTRDATGIVMISVGLRNRGSGVHVPGNIIRIVSVEDAKVSEVFAAIERALFGEETE